MAISIVQQLRGTTGSASAAATPTASLSGAAVGDLILAIGTCERGTLAPALTMPSEVKTIRSEVGGSNMGVHVAWCRLTASSQLSGGVALTNTNSNRRMAFTGMLLRGAGDPTGTTSPYTSNGNGVLTATGPVLRPAKAGSLLALLAGMCNIVTPYQRAYAVSGSGWGEYDEIGSTSTSANNAYALIATLTGASTTADAAAPVVTDSQEKFGHMLTGVVIPPADVAAVPAGWREVRAYARV